MGIRVFLIVLSLSLSGILVEVLLFAIKPMIRNRFSKKWQYYIWTMLLLRLLVPITTELNLIGNFLHRIEMGAENTFYSLEKQKNKPDNMNENTYLQKDSNDNLEEGEIVEDKRIAPYIQKGSADSTAYTNDDTEKPKGSRISNVEERMEYVWLIWLFGIIFTLSIKLVDYRGFVRYVKANNEEVTDKQIQSHMDDIMMDFGIRSEIGLYQNKLLISPMMVGIRRPFIVLPVNLPEESEVKYILAHELMHYKRKDIWYKWLFQAVFCIHWFNPFLHFVNQEINRSCELACDEAVILKYSEQERKEYGIMLLNMADQGIHYRNNVFSTTLVENKKNLKERLKHIMNYKKQSKRAIICSAAVISALSCFAVVAGAKSLPAETITAQDPETIAAEVPEIPILQNGEVQFDKLLTYMDRIDSESVSYCLISLLKKKSSEKTGMDKTASSAIELELTKDYDDSDPFLYEKLFYVQDDSIDTLILDISFEMKGKSGKLEIADNRTKEIFWSDVWNKNADSTSFTITLDKLVKDREYVIRFTGTKIEYAKVMITSKDNNIKERERPITN